MACRYQVKERPTMRNLLSAFGIAAIACSASVFAQAPAGQMGKKPMMKDGPMTVSGCVATATGASGYTLTNVTHKGNAMAGMEKKDHMTPAMSGHPMTYVLVGGDLKAHVGHKVEVTGTMSKADMDQMAKMDHQMAGDKMAGDKKVDHDMKAMTFTVASVKMIAATCP